MDRKKTMNPNALVREIVAAFRELEQELWQQDLYLSGAAESTQVVLTTLCELGNNLGYTSRSTDYIGEWLYDACWHQYDTSNRLISVPMVAECEWKDFNAIVYDFQKLLLARSAVRVMVYDSKYADVNQLCEYINAFNGAQGDTYLLAAGQSHYKLIFTMRLCYFWPFYGD